MRPYGTLCIAVVLLAISAAGLNAQRRNDHVMWELLTPTLSGKPGEVVNVKIRLTTAPKAHIYSFRSYENDIMGPIATAITAGDTTLWRQSGEIVSDVPPISKKDPNFADVITEYWEGTVTLTIPVRIEKSAKRGEHAGWVNVYFMTCTDRLCRPPTDQSFEITVNVKGK